MDRWMHALAQVYRECKTDEAYTKDTRDVQLAMCMLQLARVR
jgi:hypothetical protein